MLPSVLTKVLLIEASSATSGELRRVLQASACAVETAQADFLGLSRFERERYDLVLINRSLDGSLLGLDVVREIRSRTDVPILVVIGAGHEQLAVRALQFGANDYLVRDANGGYLAVLPTVIARTLDLDAARKRQAQAAEVHEKLLAVHDVLLKGPSQTALQRGLACLGTELQLAFACIWIVDREHDCVRLSAIWEDEVFQAPGEALTSPGRDVQSSIKSALVSGQSVHLSCEGSVLPDTLIATGHDVGIEAAYLIPSIIRPERGIVLGAGVCDARRLTASTCAILDQSGPLLGSIAEAAIYRDALEEMSRTLNQQVAQRTHELQVLYGLSQDVGNTLEIDKLLKLLLDHLHRAVPYDVAAGLLVNQEIPEVLVRSTCALSPEVVGQIRHALVETVNRLGDRSRKLEELDISPLACELAAGSTPIRRLGSLVQVPLISPEKRELIGLLLVAAEARDAFDEAHIRVLYGMANSVINSSQRIHQLVTSEMARLETIFRYLPDAVFVLDKRQCVIHTNSEAQALCRRFGIRLDTQPLLALGDLSLDGIVAEDCDSAEYEISLNGVAVGHFELTSRSIEIATGIDARMLVVRDVTELTEQRQLAEQQARLAAVGQLAAGIAHDFNNILAVIVLYAALMGKDKDISPKHQERLAIIDSQAKRASDLIQQILDFSRNAVLDRTSLDLVPFVKELVKLLTRALPESIGLTFESSSECLVVNADPTRIQQALMNLVVNARDAMPSGGQLSIKLDLVFFADPLSLPNAEIGPGSWVRIAVTDTGSGIADADLPHIFEPFFTTKSVGEGTGLGLAQVYGIIRQHEGTVTVDTEIGHGTSFNLYMPAVSVVPCSEPRIESPISIRGTGQVIMIVEDQVAVRDALREVLETAGYCVLAATNGKEALALYEAHSADIDLVLTDLVMPEMGGIALLDALRQQAPHVGAVVLSGYPLDKDAHSLRDHGIVDWLQKPVIFDRLIAVIQNALHEREG